MSTLIFIATITTSCERTLTRHDLEPRETAANIGGRRVEQVQLSSTSCSLKDLAIHLEDGLHVLGHILEDGLHLVLHGMIGAPST